MTDRVSLGSVISSKVLHCLECGNASCRSYSVPLKEERQLALPHSRLALGLPLQRGAAQFFEAFPMALHGRAAGAGDGDLRRRRFAGVAFFDRHQLRFFELREVGGEVAFGEAGEALEEEEVGVAAGGKRLT